MFLIEVMHAGLITDTNFNQITSYYNSNASIYFYSIYNDSTSSLFYVLKNVAGVSIFDTNCYFQWFRSLGGYTPGNTLSYFNGNLYGDNGTSNVIASVETGAIVAKYNSVCSGGLTSITIDSFGYMAVGCGNFFIMLKMARIWIFN